MPKSGFLAGYKTYVLAAVAIVAAIAGYSTGELDMNQALAAAWAGGVAAALRAGIARAEL